MKTFPIALAALLCCAVFPLGAAPITDMKPWKEETPEQRDARMEWWRAARFGMFIHWGVYSVPAGVYHGNEVTSTSGGKIPNGEWIMNYARIPVAEYRAFAKQFNPVKYDPDAWVRLAKEAGQKYIVITAKHHDGFALFDSKVTDWDVVDATPHGRDLLKPLAEACQRHGMKLGFYYSQAQDWTHPGGAAARGGHWDPAQDGDMTAYIKNIAEPQVREILTNYGPVAVLWWDTPVDMTPERADWFGPAMALQPGIIANNRLRATDKTGDFQTPEQYIPATGLPYDWETCMTINNTWGFKTSDTDWKSTETLLRNLVDVASKGGNLILNVGPTAEGEIPGPCVERLKAMGAWLKVNGESIYGTSASPFHRLLWGRCTTKALPPVESCPTGALCWLKRLLGAETGPGTALYLHVFDWPADGRLVVTGLRSLPAAAQLLATGEKLSCEKSADGVIVKLPAAAPDPLVTTLRLDFQGTPVVEKILPRPAADGSIRLDSLWADIHNTLRAHLARVEAGAESHIGNWTEPEGWLSWTFAADKPGTYRVVADLSGADGQKISLELDADKQSVVIPPQSAPGFAKAELGTITLPSPGEHTLGLRPAKKDWKEISLRSLTLVPQP